MITESERESQEWDISATQGGGLEGTFDMIKAIWTGLISKRSAP